MPRRELVRGHVIHLGSRTVFVSPGTYHPNEDWVLQQARNASMWLEDRVPDPRPGYEIRSIFGPIEQIHGSLDHPVALPFPDRQLLRRVLDRVAQTQMPEPLLVFWDHGFMG